MGLPVYKRILDLFEAEGVNTLFGIPDPNFVHMFAEADARGWSVVAPHHELSAGFMAEAVSRMTGGPGLCIGTLGPGMANIAGAMTPIRPTRSSARQSVGRCPARQARPTSNTRHTCCSKSSTFRTRCRRTGTGWSIRARAHLRSPRPRS